MNPPTLARMLVAASAPANDYEIVAGDLHEEYLRTVDARGVKAANRWYWTQTLRSVPSLLSYSRSKRSALADVGVALISLLVLFAILCVATAIAMVLRKLFGVDGTPLYVVLCVNYVIVAVFGAILARLVRTDGLRVAFFASLFLVLCFVVPALAGNPGSQGPLVAWIQLWGAIPAMCFGAGLYQALSHGRSA